MTALDTISVTFDDQSQRSKFNVTGWKFAGEKIFDYACTLRGEIVTVH